MSFYNHSAQDFYNFNLLLRPLGASSQFQKQSYSTVDSLGTPYDYQSMMHYNWNAFGRKSGDFGLQTIRTKDRSKQWLLGQRDGFSKIDVIQINKLYRCGLYLSFCAVVKSFLNIDKIHYKIREAAVNKNELTHCINY